MNEIKTCKCDSCGKKRLGVELYHYGAPVLFLCAGCDKKNFEAQARIDIDKWLSGS